jgi:hypothetical protein
MGCHKQAGASAPAAPFQLQPREPVELLKAIDDDYFAMVRRNKIAQQPA